MAAPPTSRPARAGRPPIFQHPWRVGVVVVTLLVVVNLGVLMIHGSNTDSPSATGLPSSIESVMPGNGELIRPEDTIGVDLRDNLTGVLQVSGPSVRGEIPEDQLERVEPLGQVTFRPGPNQDVTKWEPGTYQATVLFWPQGKDRPAAPGSYSWTFRVGA